MGETAGETERELEDTRADIESKVTRLREAVESSIEFGDRVRVRTYQVGAVAGISALAIPAALAVWLMRRRRHDGGDTSDDGRRGAQDQAHSGAGERIVREVAKAAAAAAVTAIVNRATKEMDRRQQARENGLHPGA